MQYLCGMKHRIIHIALLLTTVCNLAAQTIISGMVKSGQEPLVGANVFIIGTIDGCLTDSLGRFSFSTSKTGEASIKITMIGFEEYMQTADASKLHNLSIQMKEKATAIQEVVISASTYSFGKSENFKTMDALDVVMAGNSCGDIVAALQTLPGTQKVGENVITAKRKAHTFKNEMCFPQTKTKCELKKHSNLLFECFFVILIE